METLNQLKARFTGAFGLYSKQDAANRALDRSSLRPETGTEGDALHRRQRELSKAERDYRDLRSQYIKRLLSLRATVDPGPNPIPAAGRSK